MASWLDPDDYYRYSRAFRKWLSDTHDRMITEMPSDEARALFAGEFAPLWNEGRLGGSTIVSMKILFDFFFAHDVVCFYADIKTLTTR